MKAIDCLAKIAELSDLDHRFLYLCAIDAQDVGSRNIALRTLQFILARMDTVPSVISKLPVFLRVTMRLNMTETEDHKDSGASVEPLCTLYERGNHRVIRCGSSV